MSRIIDITGKHFGHLTVLYPVNDRIYDEKYWICRCDCGNITEVSSYSLRSGHSKSCGCGGPSPYYKDGTNARRIYLNQPSSNNTTGVVGVSKKQSGKYEVKIQFKGKNHYIGIYDDIDDARQARKLAEHMIFAPYLDEFAEKHPDLWEKLTGLKRA